MNKKLRIVFVYCEDDPWIVPIVGDFYKAAKTSGHEVFVVGTGEPPFVPEKNHINIEFHKSIFYLSKYPGILKNIDLEEQFNRDVKLAKMEGEIYATPEDEIKKRAGLWFAEAIAILKIIQPDIVIVWNGLFRRRGAYAEVAKFLQIPLYYSDKGLLPNSWYIDPKGVNALSTIAEKNLVFDISHDSENELNKKLEAIDKKGESAWEQPERKDVLTLKKILGIRHNQKVIFFPGQTDIDSNIILFSPNFKNSLNVLQWLTKGLFKDKFFVLAKPHPKGNMSVRDFNKVLENKGKAISDINILDAIRLSDCVVSINSTVAFEAAIREKPVLLLGKGVLNNREFVSNYIVNMDSSSQIEKCIERYNKDKQNLHKKALLFAAFLNSEYCIYKNDITGIIEIINRIENNTDISVKYFTADDVSTILTQARYKHITYKDMASLIRWRTLVAALIEKIKIRFKKLLDKNVLVNLF